MDAKLKLIIDSIRRHFKIKNQKVTSQQIQALLWGYCSNLEDYSAEIRKQIIADLNKQLEAKPEALAYSSADFVREDNLEQFLNEESISEIEVGLEQSSELIVTKSDKISEITTQSETLGLALSPEQTEQLACSVGDTFTDYHDFVATISESLSEYLDYKFDQIDSSIGQIKHQLKRKLRDRNQQANSHLEELKSEISEELQGFRQCLQSSKFDFKRRFAISNN